MSFISYLINGLGLGSVYAIIALGYTMVYGIAKMLNFAHGDVIMIGAYVALLSMTHAGMPVLPAVLISVVACTVLGLLIERVAYKPLRNASSSLAVLITAIGVSYLLQNIALLLFGANAPVALIMLAAFSMPRVISVASPQRACIQAPIDHTAMAHKYPFFVPIQSMKRPANRLPKA